MAEAASRRRVQGKTPRRSKPGKPVNKVVHLDELLTTGKRATRGVSQTSEGVLVNANSGANAAVSITLAAVAGRRNGYKAIVGSYSAAPTGGRLTVTDNAVTVLDIDITAAGPFVIPLPDGIQNLAVNTALVATLAAAGAAVVGKINLSTVLD